MKFARIHEGKVVEICVPVEGFTIEQCFHSSIVNQLVSCPDEVQQDWTYADGTFTAPVTE